MENKSNKPKYLNQAQKISKHDAEIRNFTEAYNHLDPSLQYQVDVAKGIMAVKMQVFLEEVKTIFGDDLASLVKRDTVVLGSAFADLANGDEPKDYDIFFTNPDTAAKVVKAYIKLFCNMLLKDTLEDNILTLRVNGAGVMRNYNIVYPQKGKFTFVEKRKAHMIPLDAVVSKEDFPHYPVALTENSLTLSSGVQLIYKFTGTMVEHMDRIDYDICKVGYSLNEDTFVSWTDDALSNIVNKRINFTSNQVQAVRSALLRYKKFLNKGYIPVDGFIENLAIPYHIEVMGVSEES